MFLRRDHFRILQRLRRIRRGRFVPALAGGAFLTAAVILAGSVWIEDRFPSNDAKHALAPGLQRVVTKPIVNVLSHQLERLVRRRAAALYMNSGLTLEQTLARFTDESVDLSQRRIYAYRLARIGSPECIAALLKVFQSAPPEHKAFMAQLIGSTGNPAAAEWLRPLLDDPNDRVVIAAITGLSAIGGDDITAQIAAILADGNRNDEIRLAAANGLGTLGSPAARDALISAFNQNPPADLRAQILDSLGRFDFSTVAATFEQYLEARATPHELRVVAAEALANSSDDAVPLLLQLAGSDADPNVRASAAWSISAHDTVSDLGPTLAALAEREQAADVRRRLYEALLTQDTFPADRLLPVIQAETDIPTRVAGYNALGSAIRQDPGSAAATAFDDTFVPELVRIATSPNSLNLQMRAVFALRRAQTPAARNALAIIAENARPQVVSAARNGLSAAKANL